MIYPMFAMIFLTFLVGAQLFRLRLKAVKSGKVRLSSFRLNTNTDTPPDMLQAMRNYSNLFEVPVLFYVAGTLAIATHIEAVSITLLAWLFVAARAVHSWIHLTYNNVIHRMQAFMAGNVCLILIWILLLLNYASR
ncbi:MAG: hypothetical protein EOP47_27650 [Sphingobacteriaceae bacterium]|nr:MAG: hypothetical protein EOP47_27650 [Sphingobacteriaceae bacterium]